MPFSDLRYERYLLRRERKRAKMRIFSPILHNDTTSNSYIANRRPGGESTHRIAYFIHRSICGAANIQILNWSERCGDSTSPQIRQRRMSAKHQDFDRFRIHKSYLVRLFRLFRFRFFPTGRPPLAQVSLLTCCSQNHSPVFVLLQRHLSSHLVFF